jgi:hypothetical protein
MDGSEREIIVFLATSKKLTSGGGGWRANLVCIDLVFNGTSAQKAIWCQQMDI